MNWSTPAIAGFCVLNTVLAASAGYLAGRAGSPDALPADHAPEPAVNVQARDAASLSTPLPAAAGEHDEAAFVADMINLSGDVDALRAELAQLREERRQAQSLSSAGSGRSSSNVNSPAVSQAVRSVADEFLVAEGNGEGLENLDLVFQNQMLRSVNLLSTSCQGNMCRLSYDAPNGNLGANFQSAGVLSRLIAKNVGGPVDIMFENESGETVLYVKQR